MNKPVAQYDMLQNVFQAQVILLEEAQHFQYDDDLSAGLGWAKLRNQMGGDPKRPSL